MKYSTVILSVALLFCILVRGSYHINHCFISLDLIGPGWGCADANPPQALGKSHNASTHLAHKRQNTHNKAHTEIRRQTTTMDPMSDSLQEPPHSPRTPSVSSYDPLSSPTRRECVLLSSPENSIDSIQSRAQRRYQALRSPMSSSWKDRNSRISTQAQKYTLRGQRYIPFTKHQRDARRSQRQLEQRGGVENMEKFVMTQEKKRVDDRWKKEADAVASDWDQLSEIEEVEEMDPYERELEEMIRKEEEELEALIKDMSI